jgi:hypothetical protein
MAFVWTWILPHMDTIDYVHGIGKRKLTLYIHLYLAAGKWLKSDLHATFAFILAPETLAL